VKLIWNTILFWRNKVNHGKCLVVSFKAIFSANSFASIFVLVKYFLYIHGRWLLLPMDSSSK